jgi:uncharacterized protein (TIGR00297 family)
LTRGGGLAAWTVGTATLWGTGWNGGAVLAAFFVSSSLLSRSIEAPSVLDPKGNCRDASQVYANGGVAALASLIGIRQPALALWLVTATLAAAAADTWASAIGGLSRRPTRLLLVGRPVEPGASGGMTPVGTIAAAAGALVVSGTGTLGGVPLGLLAAGTLIGFLGMLLDSALGAVLQGRFRCPRCDLPSEWRVHRCGTSTIRMGGLPWLSNDGVNLAATAASGALAALLWAWRCPCF